LSEAKAEPGEVMRRPPTRRADARRPPHEGEVEDDAGRQLKVPSLKGRGLRSAAVSNDIPSPRHTGVSRYPEQQTRCMPLLDSGFRRNDGLPDDAGAARQHPDIGPPDADIAPAAEAAGTGAPVLARTAAEIRPATATEGDPLTFPPHERLRLAPGQRQEASRHHQSGRAENQQCLAQRGPPSRGSSRPSVPRSLASASIPAPRVPVAGLRIKRVSRPSPLVGEGGAAERSSGVPGEGSQNSTRRFPPHPFRHVNCELRGKITAENPLSPRGKGRGVIGKAWRSRAGAGAPSLRARAPAGRRRHADSRRRDGR
jgi:hypothetical protein